MANKVSVLRDEGHLERHDVPWWLESGDIILPKSQTLLLPQEAARVFLAPGEHVVSSLLNVGGDGVPRLFLAAIVFDPVNNPIGMAGAKMTTHIGGSTLDSNWRSGF